MKSILLDMLRADSQHSSGKHEKQVSGITIIKDGFFAGSVELTYDNQSRMTSLVEMRSNGIAQRVELIYDGDSIRISKYEGTSEEVSNQCVMQTSEGRMQSCKVSLNLQNQPVYETLTLHYDDNNCLRGFTAEADLNGKRMVSEMRMYWQNGNLMKVENLIGNAVFSKCDFICGQTFNPTGNLLTTLLLSDDLCDVFMNFGCAYLFGKGPRNMIKRCVSTKYEEGRAHSTTFEVSYHHDGYLKRIKKIEEGGNPKKDFTVLVFDWE